MTSYINKCEICLKWLFTSISYATTKYKTCELGAGESVMSEIHGTKNLVDKEMMYEMWINSTLCHLHM